MNRTIRDLQKAQWEARQAGEFRPKNHIFQDKIPAELDRKNALEEEREIREATKEVWED